MSKERIENLKRRLEEAIEVTRNQGHILMNSIWAKKSPDNPNRFCGCALSMLLLHEKGPEVTEQFVIDVENWEKARQGTSCYDPDVEMANHLGLFGFEVEGIRLGFDCPDDSNVYLNGLMTQDKSDREDVLAGIDVGRELSCKYQPKRSETGIGSDD